MNDIRHTSVPLSHLVKGACGLICAVENKDELARLQSMGVCIGRRVEVIKPGDPLILRVFGARIGLSARMAEHVQVEPCSKAPRCWEVSV